MRTVWLRTFDADLHVNRTRGVGFKAVAGDAWAGPFRKTWQEARSDAHDYNRAEKEG